MSDKKPLTDEERQVFVDNLPENKINSEAEKTFNEAIGRASKPLQSKPEKLEPADGYSDKQTHSSKAEDI
jgi:hypothetical protein